jgi:hypothetical protein
VQPSDIVPHAPVGHVMGTHAQVLALPHV